MKIKKTYIIGVLLLNSIVSFSQDLLVSEKSTATENALLGFSTAISENWAIVGSPQKDQGNKLSVGEVVFYKLTDGYWKVHQEIYPESAGNLSNFGVSVSIEGTTAVISSVGDHSGGMFSGAVYVYNYNYVTMLWELTTKLKASDTILGQRFGQSVDIKDNIILVGAYNGNGNQEKTGAAYIFEKNNGVWGESQKIYSESGEYNDYFGYQVEILDDNNIAVGAYNANAEEERSGAVFIFKKSDESWQEFSKLYVSGGNLGDLFGFSLTSGPRIQEIENTNSSIYNGVLFVGSPGKNTDNAQTGAVYIFTEDTFGWTNNYELLETEVEHNDHFGYSVSYNSSGILFVGANKTNSNDNDDAGRVYVYENLSLEDVPQSTGELEDITQSSFDHFGSNISSYGENLIISSPYASIDNLSNSGNVNFYRYDAAINYNELEKIYNLKQNTPNTFSQNTLIEFNLKKAGDAKLSIYNELGQVVMVVIDEYKAFGLYSYLLDTSSWSSGLYFCKLEINDYTSIKKMIKH